jgi:rSAM/selenodomain-associated transferase 2
MRDERKTDRETDRGVFPHPSSLIPHPSKRLSLAVILPVLNEQVHLPITLQSLLAQTEPAERLLVVDGGSQDGTAGVARAFGADVMTESGRGRGGQIAAGNATVGEDVVLVAHADMVYPRNALAVVRRRLGDDPVCPGGCLGHRFASPRWVFRVIEWFDRRRGQRGLSYGDQAQFFRREMLAAVGGFPDQPIMEDVELSHRLRQLGRPAYLDLPVSVSPRRFERCGVLRTVWTNWTFRQRYRRHGLAACRAIYNGYYS